MSINRAQLRRRIAVRLGDVTQLKATQDGTTTRFYDSLHLSGGIEAPKNREIAFTFGDSAGLVRRVTNYDLTSGYIEYAATPEISSTLDTLDMYNFRGRGWRIDEYNDAINQAIEDSFPLYRLPAGAGVEDYDPGSGQAQFIDDEITHITGVGYLPAGSSPGDNLIEMVPPAKVSGGQGWWYQAVNHSVEIRPGTLAPGGSTIIVYGFAQHPPVDNDVFPISINPEWLTVQACNILCMAALERDQVNYNRGMIFGQQADALKSSIRTRVPAHTVPVLV